MENRVKVQQSKRAVESVIRRRKCPVCEEWARVEIATMADGWERWHCKRCGCCKEYRVA